MRTHCDHSPVHVSLGAYGRTPHLVAIAQMMTFPPTEPLLGELSTAHVQICPQNHGLFSVETAQELRKAFPAIRWRLHANVHVRDSHRRADIADWPGQREYFAELARVSGAMDAPAYTAHAGPRHMATLEAVFHYVRDLEDLFGVPVGIEGHYPTQGNYWLLSSWDEYRALLESGVRYAVDLSHLNILAIRAGLMKYGLVRDLLACERCIEVHLSSNNGHADQHHLLSYKPWWFDLLAEVHPGAVMFSEGRQLVRNALKEAA